MSNHALSRIRNVAIIAHGGAGKTSLVESILFSTGVIDRMGSVEEGNTVTDFEPEEVDRKISISSAIAHCEWNGYSMNVIDTPGFINFVEDTRGCLRIADGAVIIVSGLSGVKAETEKIWKYACEFEIPRIVFVNKMDKENASFDMALGEIEKSFETSAVPVTMPVGAGADFNTVVNLLTMKGFEYGGGAAKEVPIPEGALGSAEEFRKQLIEKIAEADDVLLEKYLEGGEL
ncbi:MAG: GTP-binding protein, partial [Thermodesulfovibrionales bacterium]